MLLFALLVSLSFFFGHFIAADIEPGVLMALRFALASVMLWGLLWWLGVRPVWARFWRFALIGALMAIYFITMFEALGRTTAVSTAAVFTLTPLMAAGYGWLILRQTTGPWVFSALLIGAIGAVWVIFRADLAALMRFEIGAGEAIFFFGALAHAAVPALLRRYCQDVSPLQSSFGTTLGALLVTLVYAAPEAVVTAFAELPARVWWVLAYLTIVTTALTFFLLQYASKRLPPAKVMAYTYLVPSWVVLWEISAGRWPAALILLGVAATLVALFMLLRAEAPARKTL
ncbi:DMT family transporter [Roseibaca sp. V10]|uniref:DMT family transporter n=1 Tax=Roseinatronobacter domitianus TaxID=2940293 RepID=A0ABT0M2A5_9RHOB|nr:DMT family transporter [Roseibaca domitiana]MCL1628996.1 DMT family transporter [Roseibaca domitiana]